MSDEIDRLVKAAASKQQVPLLGQQKPLMHGLNINGMTMTIAEIEQLPEREFRELMLAVIINLVGGIYAPAPEPAQEDGEQEPVVSPTEDEDAPIVSPTEEDPAEDIEDSPENTEVPPELDTDE